MCFTVVVLILVRHGRTAANAAGVLQGRLDIPIDDVGLEQVRQVAAAIGPVDRVISSPLMRARETAAQFGQPVTVDDRWIELDYGEYDGLPLSAVPAAAWQQWSTDTTFSTPGGESMGSLDTRVRAACADAFATASDERVVVVSHVTPIKAAVAWALGCDISISFRCHLDQASVCRIISGPRGAVLRSFNEVLYAR
ncbi:MAG: histidine phosphatase family protein [Ilumatobacteraceae bacterium]